MFRRRLTVLVAILAALMLLIVGRLATLQLVYAAELEQVADRLLTRPVRYLDAPRGAILDRHGRPLVVDAPAWDVSVDYRVLIGSGEYFDAQARIRRKSDSTAASRSVREVADELRIEVAEMWRRLSAMSGRPVSEFVERSDAVRERVERMRESLRRTNPSLDVIREERAFHPLLRGLDDDAALPIRLELEARYPWLAVTPGTRRVAVRADEAVHVIGRIGQATREQVLGDPLRGDELRSLRVGDQRGLSGVEWLAETQLRGTRGKIIEDFDRTAVERADATPGADVRLAIDVELQAAALAALREVVDDSENPCGGSAVVIDAATREVLALVSYPTYSYERFSADFDALRSDMRWQPLRFRAVAEQYPPGSVCKAITLLGGLSDGIVSPTTRIHCNGHLLPDDTTRFRCWIYNQHLTTHDLRGNPLGQDAADAIRNSCNIYFYTIGGRLGAERLCDWFTRFGMGKLQGTGLLEESTGIVPTAEWLMRRQGRTHQPSDAWNYAIGQGEVSATPLQAANLAATIASGRFEPVRLLIDEQPTPREPTVEFDAAALRVLRSGMWRVVNERGGTAYVGRLDSRSHVLCGKTGSAQATPRPLRRRYTLEWPNGPRTAIAAISADDAIREARTAPPAGSADGEPRVVGSQVIERYPAWQPGEKLPSHAWFIGFTQSADTPRGDPPQGRSYAISVVIEYGGSGGHVAAPVAKRIAEYLHAGD